MLSIMIFLVVVPRHLQQERLTYLTLFSGIIYLLIMKTSSLIKWIGGLVITLTVIVYDMILGGKDIFCSYYR